MYTEYIRPLLKFSVMLCFVGIIKFSVLLGTKQDIQMKETIYDISKENLEKVNCQFSNVVENNGKIIINFNINFNLENSTRSYCPKNVYSTAESWYYFRNIYTAKIIKNCLFCNFVLFFCPNYIFKCF